MSRDFYEARKMYRDYVGYTHPLSYEEWVNLSQDKKAAALYVQFFKQILDAWYKIKSVYASEQEGVETIAQYLLKNVPIIEEKPKKYSEAWIYKVAYNCFYCISHDRICDRQRYELEQSNIVGTGTEESDTIDLFDMTESKNRADFNDDGIRNQFWAVVASLGEDATLVATCLVEGGRAKGVTKKRKEEILKELAEKLEGFKEYYY